MAVFSELIKNFNKIRDYMRDFYVYGFKPRCAFTAKSLRSYDNEKRRIESYLGDYIKWEYGVAGKKTAISLDSSQISQNPLYAAWKSKSFTSNDILLHFYLLDILSDGSYVSAPVLTERICEKSEKIFDTQIVRLKCNEYVNEGILLSQKHGKTLCYALSQCYFKDLGFRLLIDAVKFFMEAAPFGEIGSYILDNEDTTNDLFSFKHHYIVHTLEDGILFDLLKAIRQNKLIRFQNFSDRTKQTNQFEGLPLKIFVSVTTGRRYVCVYNVGRKRYTCFRLDYIKSVTLLEEVLEAVDLRTKLNNNLEKVWGVGFSGRFRMEVLSLKLHIDEEKEFYVIERIHREGRGGTLVRLDKNTFLYTKECYDTNEMSPWIKTFIGRILAIEGTNTTLIERFYRDLKSMYTMYFSEEVQ